MLHTGNVNLSGIYAVQRNGVTPGAQHDQLDVDGTVQVGGNLNVSLGSAPIVQNSLFTIIDNDGDDAVIGTFDNLPQNGLYNVGQHTFRISYTGGDGNDVVLEALTGSPVITGTAGDDAFDLRRNGNVLEVRRNNVVVETHVLGVIQPYGIVFDGGDGDDTITWRRACSGRRWPRQA